MLLDSLIKNVPSIQGFGLATGSLCKSVALDIPPYITSLVSQCSYAEQGDFCYDVGNNRVIDFITPMAELRNMAAAVSKILITVCASASGVVNIALFPLMDINLAKGVHNIANSFMYALMQMPSVTAQRCMKHGLPTGSRSGAAILMCMPDFNVPFNMLVAGLRNVGIMLDNWMDVFSIIAQRTLGIGGENLDCQQTAKSLTPAFYSKDLFDSGSGANNNRAKVVVGLTEGLYAVTDGVHAQYFNHYDSVDSQTSPYAWPIEIDTRFGVAAVTFRTDERDGMGETSTTMMGCRCEDRQGLPPIRIQCAFAFQSSAYLKNSSGTPRAIFDVVFQQRSTADYMTCSMAQISVQSVRWPATRFSGSSFNPKLQTGAMDQGIVDATVWVSPLCTSRATRLPEVFFLLCRCSLPLRVWLRLRLLKGLHAHLQSSCIP